MKKLAADLKNNKFDKLYLFFGEENYLIRRYEAIIKNKLLALAEQMMNIDVFTGKTASVEDIFDALNTMSFMAEYRLVMVKNSGLFATGRKNDSAKTAELIKDLPQGSVLVFIEENVDKRSAMYKAAAKLGRCVEFLPPPEGELADWIIREFKKQNIISDKSSAIYFLRAVGGDMDLIASEMDKLCAYKTKGSSLTTEDIETVCTKSLETRIFSLIDALGSKNADKALEIYQNLMLMKESPIMILSMIARQFRLVLQSMDLAQNTGNAEIASILGIRPFVVSECLRQSKNFTKQKLAWAVRDCLETDINIKTGKMADKLAVELLIVKYCS